MSERETHICPPSVAKWLNSPIRTLLESPKKILKPHIKPGMKIVDLGCGGGIFSVVAAQITDKNSHVYAVDVQQEMLDITSKLATRKNVSEKVSCHLCDAIDVDLEEGSADLVMAIHMVHETGDLPGTFKQIHKLTKTGGEVLILEPKMHVNDEMLEETVRVAGDFKFELKEKLSSAMARGGLFVKTD